MLQLNLTRTEMSRTIWNYNEIYCSFGDEQQMARHTIGGGGMVLFESFPVSEYTKLLRTC